MNDHIRWDRQSGVWVGTLLDPQPSDADVDAIAAEFRRALTTPDLTYVVLDFHRVAFFEANLRGRLVWLWRELDRRGGRLALCQLGHMASHPSMVQFGRVMVIRETLADALAAVSSPNSPSAFTQTDESAANRNLSAEGDSVEQLPRRE